VGHSMEAPELIIGIATALATIASFFLPNH
jgi:hypothetical protein